jgi:sugar phosphate isomerase/epimerase
VKKCAISCDPVRGARIAVEQAGKTYTAQLALAPAPSDNMRRMTSRRRFLQTVSTGMVASATAPFGSALSVLAQGPADSAPKHPFTGQLGLQLYSLRHLFAKGDVPGTLAMVKKWGLTNVELAGTYGMSATDYAALLKKTGLRAVSTHGDFNKLAEGADAVIADARTFGVEYLGCAWIPHKDRFTAADADKAVAVFNAAGKKANAAGLRFFYHCHGYEFQTGPDGTLFDRIAKGTDPALVAFQMDVFWAVRGGADPLDLFKKYPDRFPLTHIKDMKKGTAVGDPTGHAPDDSNVPLGEGMIDWPPIFRAANKVGTKYHFIEDEAPEAEKQIPKTLHYLAGLRL